MSENARRFLRFRAAAPLDREGKPIRREAVVLVTAGELAGFYGVVTGWVNAQIVVDFPGIDDTGDVQLYRTETYDSTDLEMRS